MSSMNRVTLVGTLGQDPEIRSLNNGNEVATMSLATGEKWKDKITGEKKESTEWHRITSFVSIKYIQDYMKKGTRLFVEGKLQTRKWTDKEGIERYTTEIVLSGFNNNIMILANGKEPSNTQNNNQGYNTPPQGSYQPSFGNNQQQAVDQPSFISPQPQQGNSGGIADLDDEIPFS